MLLAAITVVLANVGNVNVPACSDQAFKLCQRPVEARAAEAFAALRPDVTALIEVLPPSLCERAPSTAPANLCSGPLEPPSQVVRLLGDDVEHDCDARYGWDCLAVRRGAPVELDGGLRTMEVLSTCEDDGFTVSVGTLRHRGWPIAAAVAHPDSMDARCRADQLRVLLDLLPPAGPTLVLGDLNVDFYREDDASAEVMRDEVLPHYPAMSTDEETSFPLAPSQGDPSGEVLDNGVFLPGSGAFAPRALDHVLARDLPGSCEVQRVDGGGGMDHRAQVCEVGLPAAVAPKLRVRQTRCRVRVRFTPARADIGAVRLELGRRGRTDHAPPWTIAKGRARRLRVQAMMSEPGPLLTRRVAPRGGRCG